MFYVNGIFHDLIESSGLLLRTAGLYKIRGGIQAGGGSPSIGLLVPNRALDWPLECFRLSLAAPEAARGKAGSRIFIHLLYSLQKYYIWFVGWRGKGSLSVL